MTKRGSSQERLERVQLMLAPDESAWLDTLGGQILARTGAKVSRSEIVRAGIRTLQELDRLSPLDGCTSGLMIGAVGVLTARAGMAGD